MVQILPAYVKKRDEQGPSFYEMLQLDKALSGAGEGFANRINRKNEEKEKTRKEDEENESLKEIVDLKGIHDKKTRDLLTENALKLKSLEPKKASDKRQQELYARKMKGEKLTDEEEAELPLSAQYQYAKLNQKKSQSEELENERYNTIKQHFGQKTADIYKAAPEGGKTKLIQTILENAQRGISLDDTLANLNLDEENPEIGNIDSQKKPPKIPKRTPAETFKHEEELRKETLPIRKEYSDRAEASRKGIQNKQHLLEIIKTGKVDDPTFAALAEALPLNLGKRLLSPETVEYKAGLIEEFGDLRTIFPGQVRVKEIELLEQKIADLYLTDEQKERILNSRINAQKADLIREEAAAEIEASDKVYGLLEFRKQVGKKAKPKLEALFHKILDDQQAIIKDAENRKNIPLDINDPDDVQIISQIMKEAKGDKKKAKEIATKKGYKF